MSAGRQASRVVAIFFGLSALPLLSGCIEARLKRLEIRQLETQAASIQETSAYLSTAPALSRDYDAHLHISGQVLNRFLDGLDDYRINLDRPKGASVHIDRTQLEFQDGPPQLVVDASARNRSKTVEVKLRVRADLFLHADPTKGIMSLRQEIREVVPDVKLSIFRLRQLFFVGQLLRLESQDFLNTLPAAEVPISGGFPIAFTTDPTTELKLGDHGSLVVLQDIPTFPSPLQYQYRLSRVIALSDGLHLLFRIERTQ